MATYPTSVNIFVFNKKKRDARPCRHDLVAEFKYRDMLGQANLDLDTSYAYVYADP